MDRPILRRTLGPAFTLGLTGGIGSGKSTVASAFVSLGAQLVDTDAIARSLTLADGAAIPALRDAFGIQALAADGALDRGYMRRLAFSDAGAKRRLEAILHPLIGNEARRQAAQAGSRPVVFDVPLLTESSHWRARVDRVVVVDCPERTQVARVAERAGWNEEAARSVVAQQARRAARRAIADAVIFNDDIDLTTLHAEVVMLWRAWTGVSTT